VCSFAGTNGVNPNFLTLGNDGSLYGMTGQGGSAGYGTMFKLTTNGILTSLFSFSFTNGAAPGALTLGNDGNFYGITYGGGITNQLRSYGMGTLFQITTNGRLTTLVLFSETNGLFPAAPLTLGNDGNLYGTTSAGGVNGGGTVFRVTTNGIFTTVLSIPWPSFPGPDSGSGPGLTLGNDGNFYGMTQRGGIYAQSSGAGNGTIFKVTPDGAPTLLAAFNYTNGSYPYAALTLGSDGNFYGTTQYGGNNNAGTLFKVTTGGTLTSLASFGNGNPIYDSLTQGDDGYLYGTTHAGGLGNVYGGTVFKATTNGVLTTLFSFPPPVSASSSLTLGPDGNYYGGTAGGGITNAAYPSGMGTIFSFPGPPVTIQPQIQTPVPGSDLTLYATFANLGAPPFAFQWFLNGSPIAGATTSSIAISNFGIASAGRYSVTVSNSVGSGTASRVLRLVNSPLVLVDGVDVGGGPVTRIASAQIAMFSGFGSSAHIYYTLNGSTPSFLSTEYLGPFQLARTATVRALAYDAAYLSSAEAAPVTVEITPTYQLTTSTPGGGSMTAAPAPYSGTNHFVSNTVVTVTAISSNGWSFLGWLGDAAGANPVAMLPMTRDMAVEALFGTAIVSNVLGSGQIVLNPPAPLYPYGTTVPLAAIPQTGNYLINWAGSLSGSNNPNALLVTSPNPVVTALFGPLSSGQFALTVVPQGSGTVSISPYTNRFASGAHVTITAIPDLGQTFAAWSGDASGSQNPLQVTMSASKVITANFTSRPTLNTAPPLNRLSEQGFRFSLTGELGMAYRIEASSDLLNWLSLGWLTNDFGTSQFLDAGSVTNTSQFYRALTQ
jgi:uncharacterized repeat protein (TIGR03803 family)